MLSKFLELCAWSALAACVVCMIAALYVVFRYPQYSQWYIDRNRVAPTRSRGFWQCLMWSLGMLILTVLFLIGAYKTLPIHSDDQVQDGTRASHIE
ncbi:hypothetical protein [Burkholderia cenocepacia]|uniref:hypothetical protein n=1 Tax=Burkholderia cenocepacia TaxID=95486 RepID=UPI000846859F|nr:hypothetical protein [Burkholderia cenocepacia]